MQKLTVDEIVKAVNGVVVSRGGEDTEINGVVIDSRKAGYGTLFVPLKGEKNDGHDYIASALKAGAVSLTEKDIVPDAPGTLIKTENTRRALGDIARYYKKKYPVMSVAVTGSVGKTTTKDLIGAAIGAHYKTHITPNNYNNDLGVPLTIFGIEQDDEAAVIEMGMNHFGEIEYLAGIALPDAAVITNIGTSHIENLGSREGIFKAKTEITTYFGSDSVLFVNGDDDYLGKMESGAYRVVKFGMNDSNDVCGTDIESCGLDGIRFTVWDKRDDSKTAVFVKRPGVHNVYNALAAYCAAKNFGVTNAEIAQGIENCEYTSNRFEIIRQNGIEIINDCYNSSPDSIRAALKVMPLSTAKRKVAILGDVLEMGQYAADAHYAVGGDVAASGIDVLITAGENAARIAQGAKDAGMENVTSFPDTDTLAAVVCDYVREDDSVLVKASHGMEFYKITDAIKNGKSPKDQDVRR